MKTNKRLTHQHFVKILSQNKKKTFYKNIVK